jgi:hypothetical protein
MQGAGEMLDDEEMDEEAILEQAKLLSMAPT